MSQREQMNRILTGGYCIGCGACAAADPAITIHLNAHGMYQADISAATESGLSRALAVCPFSEVGANEDELSKQLFPGCAQDARIGSYRSLEIGHVTQGDVREQATSGGMISWLCTELLNRGLVDRVVHVHKAHRAETGTLFQYGVSSTPAEVMAGAKSRYYPVELSQVLETIKTVPGRFVVIGLPCFIKAVRRLMQIDAVVQERVRFCIGLVCGHLKSSAFADCFAWQVGIAPGQLEAIDCDRRRKAAPCHGLFAVVAAHSWFSCRERRP